MTYPTAEIVLSDTSNPDLIKELQSTFIPNAVHLLAREDNELPLAKNKIPVNDKTTVYVCFDRTCKLPVFDVNSALEQIDSRD